MPALVGENVTVSNGLEGQDDHIESLLTLWDDLQLASLDIASQPDSDMISFAQSAFYFGIITMKNKPPSPPFLSQESPNRGACSRCKILMVTCAVGTSGPCPRCVSAGMASECDSRNDSYTIDDPWSHKPLPKFESGVHTRSHSNRDRTSAQVLYSTSTNRSVQSAILWGEFDSDADEERDMKKRVDALIDDYIGFNNPSRSREAMWFPDINIPVDRDITDSDDDLEKLILPTDAIQDPGSSVPGAFTPDPELSSIFGNQNDSQNQRSLISYRNEGARESRDQASRSTRTIRHVGEGSSYDTPASKRYKKSNLNPNQDASLNNRWWETRNQFSSVAIPASSPRRPATPPNNWETANELVNLVEANVTKNPIGIIYLSASPFSTSPHLGELNLGIILDAKYRSKGYAREALQLVMKHAFDDKHCHRIQASLLNLSAKDRLISLLTQQRFGHEGTKRRSFFNPLMGEWQDVTTLAILDTDWAMRTLYKPAPKSLWDELFLRHERERDELLRWEESQNRLKRTASMETIRAITIDTDASNESDAATSTSSSFRSSTSKGKGKGKQTIPNLERRGSHDGFNSDADSESGFNNNPFSSNPFLPKYGILDDGTMQYTSGRSSPTLSDVSSLESVPRSVTPGSVASATSESDWDMFESSSSSSNFDDSE